MNDKLEISMNELSHYESLKKQDLEHRKLIKKLQLEIKALKQGQSLPIDSVSNQRELLCAFFKYFRDNGEANIGMSIEQFVDAFLAHNNR